MAGFSEVSKLEYYKPINFPLIIIILSAIKALIYTHPS